MRRKGRIFTLVELLVVIAVISILSALLLPALGKAKGMARTIKCLGNMKQIGYALLSYLDDNNETYHASGLNYAGNPDVWWMGLYLQYLGLEKATTNAQKYPCGGVFSCPTQKYWDLSVGPRWAVSYGYNAYLFGDVDYKAVPNKTPNPQAAVKVSMIKTPSEQLTHVDTDCYSDGHYSGNGYCNLSYYTYLCMRHNKSANVLYADGHASTESYRFLLYMDPYTYPLNFYCENKPYVKRAAPQSDITFNFSPY